MHEQDIVKRLSEVRRAHKHTSESTEATVPCPMGACPDTRCDCEGTGLMPRQDALLWLEREAEILCK